MIIKKVFNNNSVLVFQGNEDVILTGKGIGCYR
ncbi:CAT RNA binding domain-containing protein [Anaerolactibacter massiliensis]|nr:CAT RNA binding domain-containing protein [Anaerolactibacter massiliensis]